MIRTSIIAFSLVGTIVLAGCQKDDSTAASKTPSTLAKGADHQPDDGHNHEITGGHGDEGPFMDVGTATAGGWTLAVTRDEGDLSPGGEAAIDCTVTGGAGKVSAVRFWIGTEDGKGSIKALASIENPAEPNRWHTHAEIPNPFGDESKLWVEVEDSSGAKHVAGFDLKK